MSFGMYVSDDSWEDQGSQGILRSIKKAQLFEMSVVTDPAYESSSVSARSLFPEGLPSNAVLRMKALSVLRETVPPVDPEEALRWSELPAEISKS